MESFGPNKRALGPLNCFLEAFQKGSLCLRKYFYPSFKEGQNETHATYHIIAILAEEAFQKDIKEGQNETCATYHIMAILAEERLPKGHQSYHVKHSLMSPLKAV